MGRVGLGLELGMELAGKKPGMILEFDELNERAIGRSTRNHESLLLHRFTVVHVELVAVAMPFEDFRAAIDLMSERVLDKHGRTGSQSH